MNDWLGIGLVFGILVILLVGLSVLKKYRAIHPELSRKLVHIGMGLVTLSFPLIFKSIWPVIVLSSLSILLLASIQFLPALHQKLGGVLGQVDRASLGDIYFPIAVMILFILAHDHFVLYGIPLLILTLADATSALIGVQYGQTSFSTSGGKKSVEGSVAFFTVAFLSTQIPLLLFTNTGRLETVLIAVVMGILLMILEAVGSVGLDNIFIPLGAYVFLKIYLGLPPELLVSRLIVLILILSAFLYWKQKTELNASAVLTACLTAYVFWAIGGWLWLLPALIVFFAHHILMPHCPENQRIFGSRVVLSTAAASLFWLFLATVGNQPNFVYPHVTALSCHFSIIAFANAFALENPPQISQFRLLLVSVLKGWILILMPYSILYWALYGFSNMMAVQSMIGLLITAFCTLVFQSTQKHLDQFPNNMSRWVYRGALVAGCSALALLTL